MHKFFLLNCLIFCMLGQLSAQEPKITGKMSISIIEGTIRCDFNVTNIPWIKDYYVFLNSGLNIRYFRNLEDTKNYVYHKNYDDTVSNESFGYYFPDNTGKAKFLPKAFRISYVGAFPVVLDTTTGLSRRDWKGNIALNGQTIRATEQSAWYPVLYDIKEDKSYTNVSYDIDVTCSDCNSIYINGSNPVTSHFAHLSSDSALELLLYAGNYKIDSANNTYFLNTDMTKDQLIEFGKITEGFKKFYEEKLSIPYKYDINYIQTNPLTKNTGFLFVTYPSIVSVEFGGFKDFFGKSANRHKSFIAHELGHYYFGNYAKFNTEFESMITESFAEYLSLKATQKFLGDSIYKAKLNQYIKNLGDNYNPVPIGKIKAIADFGSQQKYNYDYAPLILTAIEKEIGEEKMWKWLRLILTTKTEFTNYEFLRSTLDKTLGDSTIIDKIDAKYFKSDTSVQNAISKIGL